MAKKTRKKKTKKKNTGLLRWALALGLTVLVLLIVVALGERILSQTAKNPYGPEDFTYENGYLTCKTTESELGIDVSRYQGEIDWQQVRAAGIEFVFVRVGYRSAKDGSLNEDIRARENLRGAKEAGLKIGAYFFSQAVSAEEAREEAEFALSIVKDYEIDLPLVYDWEYVNEEARTSEMISETMMACIHSFCDVVEAAGYEKMVYFNRDLARRLLAMEELTEYKIWFAMYEDYPDAPCKPDYWQYTNEGSVPGIEGNVDINLFLP